MLQGIKPRYKKNKPVKCILCESVKDIVIKKVLSEKGEFLCNLVLCNKCFKDSKKNGIPCNY